MIKNVLVSCLRNINICLKYFCRKIVLNEINIKGFLFM